MNFDTLEQAQKDGRAPWTNVQLDTRDFVVYEDAYPVTEGHTLVVLVLVYQSSLTFSQG